MVRNTKRLSLIALLLVFSLLLSGCSFLDSIFGSGNPISLDDIPEFSGEPFVVINGGIPFFTDEEITTESFERYSELDELGRCGVAFACVGRDIMPTEKRDPNLDTEPSGWHSVKYDCVSGKFLYNRCHLIGHQLTGENDNEKNLITGTRYLNMEGMLPFENMVADYVKETGNHVMYRVTPIFGNNYDLVVKGVLMEAYSVEDKGEGRQFNVFCYNVQPGVEIDYFDGDSWLSGETPPPDDDDGVTDGGGNSDGASTYVLNTKTKKVHLPTCHYAESMTETNRAESDKTLEELINDGYTACGTCKPDEQE